LAGVALDHQLALAGDPSIVGAQEVLERAPHYLRAQLEFPYLEGAGFVCELHQGGGWGAVDAAYRDLPTTTAQILFPDRYAARVSAADPRDPGLPGGRWARARMDSLGAAQLLWLFEAPGGDIARALDDPRRAATAWAGGEIHLYTDGPATAVGVALVEGAGAGLCDAIGRWYRAAFREAGPAPADPGEALTSDGPTQDAVLHCDGADVRLGIAPDLSTARALAR
jgi:hypothetical protein